MRFSPRYLLWLVFVVFSALLLARGIIGPYRLGPAIINGPLNLEGIVAVGFVLLILRNDEQVSVSRPRLRGPIPLMALLALATAVYWSSLGNHFLSDDYIHILRHRTVQSVAAGFLQAGGDGAYRPVGEIFFLLASHVAGTDSFRCHLLQLALHLVNIGLVWAVARKLYAAETVPLVAAGLFAFHGSRPEAVVWFAASYDLLAAAFTLAGVWVYLRLVETGKLWFLAAGLASMVMAIWSKESAYCLLPLLVLLPLTSDRLRAAGRSWWIPFAVVTLLLFVWRWVLFHGPGGYTRTPTGRPQILNLGVISTVKALFFRAWALLFFPVNWSVAPDWLAGCSLCAGLGALVVLVWMRAGLYWKRALYLLGAILCALIPVVHLLLIGPGLTGARLLYLPVFPFALFVGLLAASVRGRAAAALGAALVLSQALALGHNLSIWKSVSELAYRTCVSAAQTGAGASAKLPATVRGVFFLQSGFPECVQLNAPALRQKP